MLRLAGVSCVGGERSGSFLKVASQVVWQGGLSLRCGFQCKGVTPQVQVSISCHMKTLVFGFSLAAIQWVRPVSLELSGPSSRSASSESGGERVVRLG